MNPSEISTFLIIFVTATLLSKRSSGAHYQYEACVPKDCGNGLNISFPFYIPNLQESYCGYPGFHLNCTQQGDTILQLPGNNTYVVESISYHNRSFRVYNSDVLSSNRTNCLPRIRNTTLPTLQFGYVNVTSVRLFHNCSKPLSEDLLNHKVMCDGKESDNWDFALYDVDDDRLKKDALENCERNVVVEVEKDFDDQLDDLSVVLKRGFLLNWTASDCNRCETSGGRCGFDESSFHFRCLCPDRPHSGSCKPERSRVKLILATALPGGAVFMLFLLSLIIWQRKKRTKDAYLLTRNQSSKSDIEVGSFYFGIPVFSYTELQAATNNFDASKELGDGGFGTVYYGKLKDGREVAIKRLYEHNYKRVEQFLNEIKILTCLRHKNLVSLYGCTSRTSRELLLVYEYVPNGTVASHLHGEKAKESPLTWPVRMNIAIETANALAYLHKSDIIHRDVKTENILLDENFTVKVADFGLSRLFPTDVTHISTAPQGTPGYVDPEYHQCYQLTDKSDVYSFGVVLIELVSSMLAVDINRHRHEINLANLAMVKIQSCAFDELIDSSIGYGSDDDVTRMSTSVAELAFRCLQFEKELRPSMDEVVHFLNNIWGGEEVKFDKVKVPPSPETDDVVLLKNKNLRSPIAVTDKWDSIGSTTTSSVE